MFKDVLEKHGKIDVILKNHECLFSSFFIRDSEYIRFTNENSLDKSNNILDKEYVKYYNVKGKKYVTVDPKSFKICTFKIILTYDGYLILSAANTADGKQCSVFNVIKECGLTIYNLAIGAHNMLRLLKMPYGLFEISIVKQGSRYLYELNTCTDDFTIGEIYPISSEVDGMLNYTMIEENTIHHIHASLYLYLADMDKYNSISYLTKFITPGGVDYYDNDK